MRTTATHEEASSIEEPAVTNNDGEDYYDAGEAKSYSGDRGYYDMTYNDPYYYNYGRFGFGMGLGMGGYSGYPYGSMYYGYGSSYPGWYDPYWGYGWNSPYYSTWGSSYYGYGSYWPYGGYYSGYGSYCGYGYYGPGSWYNPPIYVYEGGNGNGNSIYTGHRPSLTDGVGPGTQVAPNIQDPGTERIRLYPGTERRPYFEGRTGRPTSAPTPEDPERQRHSAPQTRPSRNNDGPRINSGGSAPSRDVGPSRSTPGTGGSGGNTGHRR
ncbi:MAG: hypothetical protein H6595_00910 [Flavobacteriales bacterium]|nr:hypothetical protein [Flavobacteriales bacterium]MCB9166018.1 hypothetical protein [Flavobacteriales bacterium]